MADLIDRQAAIAHAVPLNLFGREVMMVSVSELENLPSAQPERKKGHWIKISPANIYECSECGKNVMTDDISAYDFCHGCGAEMEGEKHV